MDTTPHKISLLPPWLLSLRPAAIRPLTTTRRGKEGQYYVCWWEGETKRMERVGPHAADAENARLRREHILAALNDGVEIAGEGEESISRIRLANAAAEFLSEMKEHRRVKTYLAYRNTLDCFVEACGKKFADQLERGDLMDFQRTLKHSGLADRTVFKMVCKARLVQNLVTQKCQVS